MAHQTAVSHRVQPGLPQRWLQLGTTMKRTSLAKEAAGNAGQCNSLSMAQHARKEYKMELHTQSRSAAAHTLVDGCVVSFDSGGSQGRNS